MKMSKKVISIILAVVLTVGVVTAAFVVSATTKETAISVLVDKTQIAAGESATVSVKVTANYAIATMSIPVFYDKTLVSVSDATATLTDYSVKNVTTDAESVDSSKIYANTDVSADNFGFVLVNYIGEAGAALPVSMESVVLTFKITAKSDVSGEAVLKVIAESAKTDENIAGMLYFGSPASGTAIDSVPENVENIDVTSASASVFISNGSPALKAIDGTTGFVDGENKYVYGITVGGNIEDFFTVANGTIKVVANDSGKTNGTGATVQVLDSANNVVDTYTVIIFGDVNGDAAITSDDYLAIINATVGVSLDTAGAFAADVNGDSATTSDDYLAVINATVGVSLDINPYA